MQTQTRIELNKSSNLHKLDQFLVSFGDRLGKSILSLNEAHPVDLPKQSHISGAIIPWFHENVSHGERGMTLNKVRQNEF